MDEGIHMNEHKASDVPPPDHKSEPFMHDPIKGDDVPVLNGGFGVDNTTVAQGILNAIILPEDLAEYLVVSMMTLTTRYKDIFYEVRVMLPLLYPLYFLFHIYFILFNVFPCSVLLFLWCPSRKYSNIIADLAIDMLA